MYEWGWGRWSFLLSYVDICRHPTFRHLCHSCFRPCYFSTLLRFDIFPFDQSCENLWVNQYNYCCYEKTPIRLFRCVFNLLLCLQAVLVNEFLFFSSIYLISFMKLKRKSLHWSVAPSVSSADFHIDSTVRIFSKGATDWKIQIKTLNKARNQIEIYRESCVTRLEREAGRITTDFLKNLLFQPTISRFRVTRNIELSCEDVHWIELVEFSLENEWESWKTFLGESRRFLQNLMYFWRVFWGFFSDFWGVEMFGVETT